MHFLILTFLVAIYQIEDLEAALMNKLKELESTIQKNPKHCEQFKCTDQGNPVCVRVVTNSRKNKVKNPIYIEMINKCEAEYMKCYKDYKATVVSMSYCLSGYLNNGHNNRSDLVEYYKGKLLKNNNRRQKRQTEENENELNDGKNQTLDENKNDVDSQVADKEPACLQTCRVKKYMVCGRCKHHTYKTFPSLCHLTRFNCENPTEEFQFASRYPCVLLAPYLNDAMNNDEEHPETSIEEDLVLKHIICRTRPHADKDLYCNYNNNYINEKFKEAKNEWMNLEGMSALPHPRSIKNEKKYVTKYGPYRP